MHLGHFIGTLVLGPVSVLFSAALHEYLGSPMRLHLPVCLNVPLDLAWQPCRPRAAEHHRGSRGERLRAPRAAEAAWERRWVLNVGQAVIAQQVRRDVVAHLADLHAASAARPRERESTARGTRESTAGCVSCRE